MPETRPRWTGIAASIALVVVAVGLVVLGAAYGPTQKYLLPSETFDRDNGREVVVGGTVVGESTNNGHPVFLLADDKDTWGRRVQVEYVGPAEVEFGKGATAIFVGTVKHAGVIKARECVNHPTATPLATTSQSASN